MITLGIVAVICILFLVMVAGAVSTHDSRMIKAKERFMQRHGYCPGHCVNFGPCDTCAPPRPEIHNCPVDGRSYIMPDADDINLDYDEKSKSWK